MGLVVWIHVFLSGWLSGFAFYAGTSLVYVFLGKGNARPASEAERALGYGSGHWSRRF